MAMALLSTPAFAAPGDIAKKFRVNEDNPSASIPSEAERNANPIEFGYFIQDLYTRAELAIEKKDWASSAKYYEALARILPDRAICFSKLCQSYQGLGKTEFAAANCAKAIQLEGATLLDHQRFIAATLDKKTLSPKDVEDLDASMGHVRAHLAKLPEPVPPPKLELPKRPPGYKPSADEVAKDWARVQESRQKREQTEQQAKERASFLMNFAVLGCRLGVRLRDAQRLNQCLDELRRQKADERVILTFDWSKALVLGDRERADALLARAKQLGISEPTLRAMLSEQEKAFSPSVVVILKRWGAALAAGLLVLGGAAIWIHRRRSRAGSSELAPVLGSAD